jgi:hypothetical protein
MVYERLPWRDRFREPGLRELRSALTKSAAHVFDRLRAHMGRLGRVSEHIVWYGSSWGWTIEYRLVGRREPLAVMIPSPEDLRVAVPIEPAFVTSLPRKGMKRAIREGLELASEPFDNRWAVWSVSDDGMANDLGTLLDRRLHHLVESARAQRSRPRR